MSLATLKARARNADNVSDRHLLQSAWRQGSAGSLPGLGSCANLVVLDLVRDLAQT